MITGGEMTRGSTKLGKGRAARRFGRVAAAGAALTAALTVAAPAASAERAQAPECTLGYVCAFNVNTLVAQVAPIRSGQCYTTSGIYNTMDNNTNQYQRMWTQPGCTGNNVLISPYEIRMTQAAWRSIGGY